MGMRSKIFLKEIKDHADEVRASEGWEEEAIAEAMAIPVRGQAEALANDMAAIDAKRARSARRSNTETLSVRLPKLTIEMIEAAAPDGKASKRSRKAAGLREILRFYQQHHREAGK